MRRRISSPWRGASLLLAAIALGASADVGYEPEPVLRASGILTPELLAGGREDELPLPLSEPERVSSAPIMSRLYQAAFTANQIIKSF